MKKHFTIILAMILFCGCTKQVLDKTDLTGVDESTWNSESIATLYLNKLYQDNLPTFPSGTHNTSDDSNGGDSNILYGTLTSESIGDFSLAYYTFIRNINILLTEIDKGTLPATVRDKIKGQAYFLRAWRYFQLVRLYGGVPMVLRPQAISGEDLNVKRNTSLECLNLITQDLDSSATMLTRANIIKWPATDLGRITRGAAYAMKGRVLLYLASPQFNPKTTPAGFNSTYDATLWERAYQANKQARDILSADGYALKSSYKDIWDNKTESSNPETIFIRSYDGVNALNSYENGTRPFSESTGGGSSNLPTLELVKSYPMNTGLAPIAANGYDNVYYWKNRDPRFYATIAYNGAIYGLSSTPGRKQWTYVGNSLETASRNTSTGFYCRKAIDTTLTKDRSAYGATDFIEMRYAEVLMNLAECANASGRVNEAYDNIILLRKRAGIPAGTGLYGLTPGMTTDQMADAIMLERRIEFAFEGKRYYDLRRTRTYSNLNGTVRHGLLITVKAPYTIAAVDAIRDNLNLSGSDYTTYFTATENIIDTKFTINFLPNYYFYGLPLTQLQKNSNLQQTKGWPPNDTFDPLANK